MAWIHSMWVATEHTQAEKAILEHFQSFPENVPFKDRNYSIKTFPYGMISADGPFISNRGIESVEEAEVLSLLGFEYYKRLLTAPTFAYALTGVEVDGLITLEELYEDPTWPTDFSGFVIREDIYKQLGLLNNFVPFRAGYWWNPYKGESLELENGQVWEFWEERDLPILKTTAI